MGNENCIICRHSKKLDETMIENNHHDDQQYVLSKNASLELATTSQHHCSPTKLNNNDNVSNSNSHDETITIIESSQDDGDIEGSVMTSLDFSQDIQSISEREITIRKTAHYDPYESHHHFSPFKEGHQHHHHHMQHLHHQSLLVPIMHHHLLRKAPSIDETIEKHLKSPKKYSDAFTSRLEKARQVQLVLAAPLSPSSSLPVSVAEESSGLFTNSDHVTTEERQDDDDIEVNDNNDDFRSFPELSSPRLTTSIKTNNHEKKSLTDLFWEEISFEYKITAIGMSRATSSTDQASNHSSIMDQVVMPPLLLAIGTEDGNIVVTEIINHRSSNSNNTPPSTMQACSPSSIFPTNKKLGKFSKIKNIGKIRSIDFSFNNKLLAVAGDNCVASIFRIDYNTNSCSTDTYQKEERFAINLIQKIQRVDQVHTVQFSKNGEQIAIGGFDGSVVVMSTNDILHDSSQSSTMIKEIERDALIFCVDWSPDGKYLAIGGSDKVCAIYDTCSWKIVTEMKRQTSIQTMKWSPDGMILAIGDHQGVAIIDRDSSLTVIFKEIPMSSINQSETATTTTNFNTNGGRRTLFRTSSICWSPDGNYLAFCGGPENTCVIVEKKSFEIIREVRRSNRVTCISWGQLRASSNHEYDKDYLVIGDDDGTVAILESRFENQGGSSSSIADSDRISSLDSASYFTANNDDDWLQRDETFRDMMNTTGGEELSKSNSYIIPSSHEGSVTAITFSRGSKSKPSAYLVFATENNSVIVRSTINWDVVAQLKFQKPIRSMMFSNGGKFLALGCEDGFVYIILVSDWSVIMEQNICGPVLSLIFSKNNERLAVSSTDGMITLLDPRNGWEAIGDIEGSDSPVLAMDWSSHNMAIGRKDGIVTVYETDKIFSNLYIPNAEISRRHPVHSVAFGVNGRFLATGSNDGVVGIYSSKCNWILCHQIKIGYNINNVRWSPTGRYLGFTGENKTFRIIDTLFWAEVDEVNQGCASIFQEEKLYFWGLTFSQDGKLAAFSGSNSNIYIMNTNKWDLLFTSKYIGQQESPSEPLFPLEI